MRKIYLKKFIYICVSVALFGMFIGIAALNEGKLCLGIPIIREHELNGYEETTDFDISQIQFSGETIAVDFPSSTVYITQPVESVKNFKTLAGKLEASDLTFELAILKTEAMDNFSETVKSSLPLTLIIKSGNMYQRVNLIITTLPILYLDFDSAREDEQGRNINTGKITLWNNASSTYKVGTTVSNAEWRLRGNSTRTFDKKAWKLNLRDEDFQKSNVDLLGLGSDDDYILNPMSMDDTFVKEKLVQELWSQLMKQADYNYQMTKGEYVELFINGAYQGLYLLQRRIDAKYLNLNRNQDILLKGINTWEAESYQDGYEIVSSPYDSEKTYELLANAMNFEENSMIHSKNFIDVSVLLQFISGTDNYGYKNTFYVLKKEMEKYVLYFVPWDTDLSFGVTWGYNYEESMNEIIERYELPIVREHVADIDKQIANRWYELRDRIYSKENVLSIYEQLIEQLDISGALNRDTEKWSLLHEGEDNRENLEKFIGERLILLDKYYENVLN